MRLWRLRGLRGRWAVVRVVERQWKAVHIEDRTASRPEIEPDPGGVTTSLAICTHPIESQNQIALLGPFGYLMCGGEFISLFGVIAMIPRPNRSSEPPELPGPGSCMGSSESSDMVKMLSEENARLRRAGSELSVAAIRVATEYDGLHRLMLAVSVWAKAMADENGRGGKSDGRD